MNANAMLRSLRHQARERGIAIVVARPKTIEPLNIRKSFGEQSLECRDCHRRLLPAGAMFMSEALQPILIGGRLAASAYSIEMARSRLSTTLPPAGEVNLDSHVQFMNTPAAKRQGGPALHDLNPRLDSINPRYSRRLLPPGLR